MNPRKHLILIKGEIKTSEIEFCRYQADTGKMNVKFHNGKEYPYACWNVEWLKEPVALNPKLYRIRRQGREFFSIEAIYVFRGAQESYWHICFEDGRERDYRQSELDITESCLTQSQAADVFQYIKQIADLSNLKNEVTGERMLAKKFDKISFVGNDVALARYLDPSSLQTDQTGQNYTPIFPFGCNNSQYKAVKNAMENQISVIQGPPGTGKTQTILNIIANILMEGKTVQIVSNNNSATGNVYEKLSSSDCRLGFVAATLGSSDNKKAFVERQDVNYPDFSSWKTEENLQAVRDGISEKSRRLKTVFDKKERLAYLRQELSQLTTELEYFQQYARAMEADTKAKDFRKNLSSKNWMEMWQECQMNAEEKQKIGALFKVKAFFKYGIADLKFYRQDIARIITIFQERYYRTAQAELTEEIKDIETYLENIHEDLLGDLRSQSMAVLKDALARRYGGRKKRKLFREEDLFREPYEVLAEYPVILSTTFSSRNSLNTNVVYDYLIMDEASQVDIATGTLALSCARNVVIVGDTKQLPNVITEEVKARAKAIFDSFHVKEGYQFTKSFLQSILEVMPDVTQTLLREHYRCHPKIIDFCNQKFYRGELIIMTKDHGEKDVLSVVKTVQGNHERNHYSQRQIDVIRQEIIPEYVLDPKETGIIAPYRNQVEALGKEIRDMDVATVHKFQGKEKETIIISTVDDEISDFADDPYLINVAVSRAKKRLILVVTGNEQSKERNITELIDYIQYHNFEVVSSRTYSVFDYLYKQYAKERKIFLQKHRKVSEFDSENLMYSLIEEILAEDKYSSLDIACHVPVNMLIRNMELLNEQEYRYARNPATHIDFLLYNRIGKKPVLAIEVDGYGYHKEDTLQASRDRLKDHILELYGIPLLRFRTNGSGEREKLRRALADLI